VTNILSLILSPKYAQGTGHDREQEEDKEKVQGDSDWSASESFGCKSPLINLHGGDKSSDMPETT